MFSVNIRAKSSCDILKSVGISRGIGIFFSPVRPQGRPSRSPVQQALILPCFPKACIQAVFRLFTGFFFCLYSRKNQQKKPTQREFIESSRKIIYISLIYFFLVTLVTPLKITRHKTICHAMKRYTSLRGQGERSKALASSGSSSSSSIADSSMLAGSRSIFSS